MLIAQKGEFEDLTTDFAGPRHFKIRLLPQLAEDEECYVSLVFRVNYTKTYPNELPVFSIEDIKGLEDEEIQEIKDYLKSEVGRSTLIESSWVGSSSAVTDHIIVGRVSKI